MSWYDLDNVSKGCIFKVRKFQLDSLRYFALFLCQILSEPVFDNVDRNVTRLCATRSMKDLKDLWALLGLLIIAFACIHNHTYYVLRLLSALQNANHLGIKLSRWFKTTHKKLEQNLKIILPKTTCTRKTFECVVAWPLINFKLQNIFKRLCGSIHIERLLAGSPSAYFPI